MVTKLTLKIEVPVEIEMDDLLPEGEFRFVSKMMSNPSRLDESLSLDFHRKWFRQSWNAQSRLQQAMLANPVLLERFIGYLAMSEIETPGIISPESIETAIRDAVAEIGEEAWFYPVFEETMQDTDEMCRDLIEAVRMNFGKPRAFICNVTTGEKSPTQGAGEE